MHELISIADYDPESNGVSSDNDDGINESEREDLGTEHYIRVGKGRLRQKENVSLGPAYRGSKVSRAALEDDDVGESVFDDPDAVDLAADEVQVDDSEIDSDDAFGSSDDERFEKFAFRGSSKPAKLDMTSAADSLSDDENTHDSSADEKFDEDLEKLIGGAGSNSEEDNDDDDDNEENEPANGDTDEEESEAESREDGVGSREPSEPAQPDMSALSNSAEVEKGVAIRKQREIYDGLLNLRIRLQKALVAANSFATAECSADAKAEPYEAAEEAAIKLLNTISSLRTNLHAPPRSGDKRKRELALSMTNQDIWEQLQQEDEAAVGFREERLERWSKKVQSVNMTRASGLGREDKTLVSALRAQLMAPDNRLIKRSKVARSCAPVQAAGKMLEVEGIYDDADFYQLLLKELVDQRTVEGNADHATALPTVMVTASKEAKLRKQVDRKASKGRKMRFTVHEKLQNFMAPEDRRRWETAAIDRFLGTLFGRKLEFNEDESEEEEEEEEGVDAEEEGLRLFRN